MKKLFLLIFALILFVSCSAQSQEKEGLNCLGYNPDNPFDLTPPEWVQGYWEEKEDSRFHCYHFEISEGRIYSDIFSYFIDGSIELSFSVLQEIIRTPYIYDVIPLHVDLDNWSNSTYFASLEASCGPTDEIYMLMVLNNGRTFSDEFITSNALLYLESAGIERTDTPEEIRSKLDTYNEEWRNGLGTEEYKNSKILIIEKIKNQVTDRKFDYDEFVCNAALATPAGQELKELMSHISVEQDIAYPAYTVTYLYDDIPFFELTFTRERESLVFDYTTHCYFDLDWEEPMETISGLSESEAEQIVYSRTIEFEKQTY